MVKCFFCECEIPEGTGVLLVKNDSKKLYFCSTKCEKNLRKLKRKPKDVKWTNRAHKLKKAIKEKVSKK